jgi:four helix bundle protein
MARYWQLKVWQRSIDLACEIYRITKSLPIEERFGLSSQLRRAAVSISANIAEGAGRYGTKELLSPLNCSRLAQGRGKLFVIERVQLATATELRSARGFCDEISKMLRVLRKRLTA